MTSPGRLPTPKEMEKAIEEGDMETIQQFNDYEDEAEGVTPEEVDAEEDAMDEEDGQDEEDFVNLAKRLAALEGTIGKLVDMLTEKTEGDPRLTVGKQSGQKATIAARQGRQAKRWGATREEWRTILGENETIIPVGFDFEMALAEHRARLPQPPEPANAPQRARASKKKATKKKASKKKATKKKAPKKTAPKKTAAKKRASKKKARSKVTA